MRVKRTAFLRMLPALPLVSAAGCTTNVHGNARPLVAATADHQTALRRIHELQARDDASIKPICRTALYDHGHTTDLAVVLFHGFTNCPAQYARFAGMLHARGCNVFVPRYPEHGDVNRMTTRLEQLRADQLTAAADEAVDAARGLGRRLAISGLSLGGVLCAWLVTQRADIDRAVILAPSIGFPGASYTFSVFVSRLLLTFDRTRYAWWDNNLKETITPKHAYPRYPLHVLGENYLIGEEVVSAQGPFPGAGRTQVVFALNPRDPAINNDLVALLADQWRQRRWLDSSVVWLDGFPPIHDVIEPTNQPASQIAAAYPRLIDLILAKDQVSQQ